MFRTLITGALLAAVATAQTWSSCNPLNATCSDDAALGTSFSTQFNKSMATFDSTLFNVTAGASHITFGNDGAELAIVNQGDSVTVQTAFYIMWGTVEIIFKAASGQGIISTVILLSDDLDEIDWELFGGNTTHISNNWYGHGDQNQHNSEYPPLANAQEDFHNFTIDWTKDRINYIADGNVVRTVNSGASGLYPQTPSYVRFGIWAGGDSTNPQGTIDWAGGKTDFSQGPFIMTVKSLKIVDGTSNATAYTYGDKTGSSTSIKVATGQSKAYQYINKLGTVGTITQSWNGLSTGAKIGIACGVVGGLAIATIAFCVYCMIQRKKGREERRIADKEWEAHENELNEYKKRMQKGGFAVSYMGHGDNRF